MNPFRRIRYLVILLALASLSNSALAGVGRWTSGGPPDPLTTAVATDPTDSGVVYAGTATGLVFRTADTGRTWQQTSFRATRVNAIVVDPTTPSTIYGATSSGVFRSTDAGGSWTPVNNGLPAVPVESLAIDPRNSAVLYAGAAGILTVNPTAGAAGIWKTTDRGATWLRTGLPFAGVKSIAIDPRNSAILYAALYAFPVMSANNGMGIWRSSDGGATWAPAESALGGPPFVALAIDPENSSTIYAAWFATGVFKSTDGGRNWLRIDATSEFTQLSALVIDPRIPSRIYLGSDRGVFRSTDAGATWSSVNCGLTQLRITSLAIDSTGRFVHAGTASGGVFGYEVPATGDVGGCPGGVTTLCLSGARFCAQVNWRTPDGRTGVGVALPLTEEAGAFWFFTPSNLELTIKVLNGTALNGNFWVFYGALTNVEFTLRVTDSQTGRTRTYFNLQGEMASHADTTAFPGP